MISILILILGIAAVGACVAFVSKLEMPVIFKNLIYLIVTLAVIFLLIHALKSGHLPEIKL